MSAGINTLFFSFFLQLGKYNKNNLSLTGKNNAYLPILLD